VTFHDCGALEFREADDADFEKVVDPIVRQQSRYVLGPDPSDYRITPRDYPVAWAHQGDDVEITLTPEPFRPNVPWTSELDDYVLLARDPAVEFSDCDVGAHRGRHDEVNRRRVRSPCCRPRRCC
jgi:hypothetical protein